MLAAGLVALAGSAASAALALGGLGFATAALALIRVAPALLLTTAAYSTDIAVTFSAGRPQPTLAIAAAAGVIALVQLVAVSLRLASVDLVERPVLRLAVTSVVASTSIAAAAAAAVLLGGSLASGAAVVAVAVGAAGAVGLVLLPRLLAR